MDRETYLIATRWIYRHPELTDTEKLTCGLILGLSANGYCYASNLYLAQAFVHDWDALDKQAQSRKIAAMRKRISVLHSKEILTILHDENERKIFLNVDDERYCTVTASGQKGGQKSGQALPYGNGQDGQALLYGNALTISIQKENSPNQDLDTIERDFVRFWSLYPRKEKKLRAEKLFKKLSKKKRSDLMAVLDLIPERYAETQKQFIPLPTSFLSDQRWYDEYFEKKIAQNGAAKVSQPETGLPEWVVSGVAQIAALADGEYDAIGAEGSRVAEVVGMTPEAAADWLDDYGRDDFVKRVVRAMETDMRGAA